MANMKLLRRLILMMVAASFAGGLAVPASQAQSGDIPAGPHLQEETQEDDSNPAMILDRLFAQLHKSDDAKTAKIIEKAIWGLWSRSDSPTANALMQQASRALAAANFAVSIKLLDTAIELKPDFAEAWNKRATAFYLDRQFDKSLADIERVLELEPRHFGALSGLGLIHRELGDEAAALKAFRRALVIHPHLPAATRAVKELETEFEQRI